MQNQKLFLFINQIERYLRANKKPKDKQRKSANEIRKNFLMIFLGIFWIQSWASLLLTENWALKKPKNKAQKFEQLTQTSYNFEDIPFLRFNNELEMSATDYKMSQGW